MKWLKLFTFSSVLALALTAPAAALEFTVSPPECPNFARSTSVEVVQTPGGGAAKNENLSKDAALIPPAFGSPGSGELLVPTRPAASAVSTAAWTQVTESLYYADGSLGTLSIPALGVSVNIFEGTGSGTLALGAGHFPETSIWDGNAAFAAHNRGVNAYFGQIHTLNVGDTITLTTRLGTRTYAVTSVRKVPETDLSGLEPASDNVLTLYTCVRDEQDYRWCVRAALV